MRHMKTDRHEQLPLPFHPSVTSAMSVQEQELAIQALAGLLLEAARVVLEEICNEH